MFVTSVFWCFDDFLSVYSQPHQWNQLASAWRLSKRYIYTRYNLRYIVKAICCEVQVQSHKKFKIHNTHDMNRMQCNYAVANVFSVLVLNCYHIQNVYLLTNQHRLRGSGIKFVVFRKYVEKIAHCHVLFYVLPNFTPVATTLPMMYGLLYDGSIGVMEVMDRILI